MKSEGPEEQQTNREEASNHPSGKPDPAAI
jgi:hypothetical protein